MKRFLAALQFLTVCPFVADIRCSEADLGRSTPFFPAVGLLIGVVVALLDRLVSHLFPPILASVVAVVALIGASGGLHMDGLADTADGFFSSRPRERILEIMKDSHVGAMGVIGIVCVFCLKVAALASVPLAFRFPVLLLMPLAGRCALVTHLAALPYARSEGGLCTVFVKSRLKSDSILAVAILALVGWVAGGARGLVAAALAVAATFVFSLWCWRKIGGFTGDTLGTACELTELVPALVGAACFCAKGAI
jgi:adenosylcobinamide-GDP ribazoletransferase